MFRPNVKRTQILFPGKQYRNILSIGEGLGGINGIKGVIYAACINFAQ